MSLGAVPGKHNGVLEHSARNGLVVIGVILSSVQTI